MHTPSFRLIGRAVGVWLTENQMRRDRAGFLAMSDHMLRDIGVSRDQILATPSERTLERKVRS